MTHSKLHDGATTRYGYRLLRQLSTNELAEVKSIDRSVLAVWTIQSNGTTPKLRVKIAGVDPNSTVWTRIASQLRQWHARH